MALYHGGEIVEGKLVCKRNGEAYTLQDDAAVLTFFAGHNDAAPADTVRAFLSNTTFFGQDLTLIPGLADSVTESYEAILTRGMNAVMTERFGG